MLKTVIPDVPDMQSSSKQLLRTLYLAFVSNVRQRVNNVYKDQAAEKFIECAHIYTESEFNKEYPDLRCRFPKVCPFLDKSIGLDKWTRCFFPSDKYNIDTSNSAKSMNNIFREARKYSLLPMIDAILDKFSEWFNNHWKEVAGSSDTKKVVPIVENELHIRCGIAMCLLVNGLNSFHLKYKVIGFDKKSYQVDLKQKSFSCRCFDIDKYLCVHAIAATMELMRNERRTANLRIYDLCSKYYLIETWALACYRTNYVVPHKSEWIIPVDTSELYALPSECTKKAGRNQETRFPSAGERRGKQKYMKFVPGIDLEKWL